MQQWLPLKWAPHVCECEWMSVWINFQIFKFVYTERTESKMLEMIASVRSLARAGSHTVTRVSYYNNACTWVTVVYEPCWARYRHLLLLYIHIEHWALIIDLTVHFVVFLIFQFRLFSCFYLAFLRLFACKFMTNLVWPEANVIDICSYIFSIKWLAGNVWVHILNTK